MCICTRMIRCRREHDRLRQARQTDDEEERQARFEDEDFR